MSADSVVPAGKAVLLTETTNDTGLVARAGGAITVTHDGAAVTMMLAPLNATLTACDGGTTPPAGAAKASVAGVVSTPRSDGSTL